jgi:hypothetical protein
MEPTIAVALKAKTGGHIDVHLRLSPEGGAGARCFVHEFNDSIDQAYLPALIANSST